MSKGAQAMVVAMRYPDADKRGRGNKAAKSEIISDFNERLVQQARLVLRVTPTIAAAVRDGQKPLAMRYPDAEKGGRGNKRLNNLTVSGNASSDKVLLSWARFVLRVTPTVAMPCEMVKSPSPPPTKKRR